MRRCEACALNSGKRQRKGSRDSDFCTMKVSLWSLKADVVGDVCWEYRPQRISQYTAGRSGAHATVIVDADSHDQLNSHQQY